jgi:hypothetical protein
VSGGSLKIRRIVTVDDRGYASSSHEPTEGPQEKFSAVIEGYFQMNCSRDGASEQDDVTLR